MKELRDSVFNKLNELKSTINKFVHLGRNDKSVVFDVYNSEYTTLITYLDSKPLPQIFKRHELKTLLNKINDELNELRQILNCYDEHIKRKEILDSDFDIVDKNTLFFHHLEDLVFTMEMYLGFDQTEKYKTLEGFFDQIIIDMKNKKIKKRQSFEQTLLDLKAKIQNSNIERINDLTKEVESMLEKLKNSESINERKVISLKHELNERNREKRKKNLQINIIAKIRARLFGRNNAIEINKLDEDFDSELQKIKTESKKLRYSQI